MANIDRFLGELESRLSTVEEEITRIRDWRHRLPNELIMPLQDSIEGLKDLVQQMINSQSMRNIPGKAVIPIEADRRVRYRDVWLVIATIIATVAVLKFIHLLT